MATTKSMLNAALRRLVRRRAGRVAYRLTTEPYPGDTQKSGAGQDFWAARIARTSAFTRKGSSAAVGGVEAVQGISEGPECPLPGARWTTASRGRAGSLRQPLIARQRSAARRGGQSRDLGNRLLYLGNLLAISLSRPRLRATTARSAGFGTVREGVGGHLRIE